MIETNNAGRANARADLSVCFYCADQNPHRDRSLGITNYTRGLLENLRGREDVRIEGVVSTSSFALPAGMRSTTLPFRTDSTLGRLAADHLHPMLLGAGRSTALWHYPKGFLPLLKQVRGARIGTIADTIVQYYADHYPQTRSRADVSYWLKMLTSSIARFDAIITVSEFSRRAIMEFCERHKVKAPPVHVTYQGATVVNPESALNKENVVIHLASRLPHKCTAWLVDQWLRLEDAMPQVPTLQLVGDVEDEVQRRAGATRNIQHMLFLERAAMAAKIAAARALILPSEIEGFGLPALEAYYLGTPVVYVRETAVEEVLGLGTPGGFASKDADEFDAALAAVLEADDAQINGKAEELRNRFDWNRVGEATVAVYRTQA